MDIDITHDYLKYINNKTGTHESNLIELQRLYNIYPRYLTYNDLEMIQSDTDITIAMPNILDIYYFRETNHISTFNLLKVYRHSPEAINVFHEQIIHHPLNQLKQSINANRKLVSIFELYNKINIDPEYIQKINLNTFINYINTFNSAHSLGFSFVLKNYRNQEHMYHLIQHLLDQKILMVDLEQYQIIRHCLSTNKVEELDLYMSLSTTDEQFLDFQTNINKNKEIMISTSIEID